jgi:hypothetical protein
MFRKLNTKVIYPHAFCSNSHAYFLERSYYWRQIRTILEALQFNKINLLISKYIFQKMIIKKPHYFHNTSVLKINYIDIEGCEYLRFGNPQTEGWGSLQVKVEEIEWMLVAKFSWLNCISINTRWGLRLSDCSSTMFILPTLLSYDVPSPCPWVFQLQHATPELTASLTALVAALRVFFKHFWKLQQAHVSIHS